MKIAVIGDTHFGARGDSPLFLNHFLKFFEEQFFPYLKEHGITKVLHLGDLFDRRKFINFNTLHHTKKRFVQWFETNGVELHCILGNHDVFYKNTNRLNSPKEVLGECHPSFHLYEEPTEVRFNGATILMVPWLNEENKEQFLKTIKDSKATILAGHLELSGYEVMPGIKFNEGMSDKFLEKFDMVLSGHFHSKSSKGNVHYLGTQYQMTSIDTNEVKGFHVLDTETRELQFIQNPMKMFHNVEWRNGTLIEGFDPARYKGTYVKVLVYEKKSETKFDQFLDNLYAAEPASVSIIEDLSDRVREEGEVDISEDTLSLINKEIDSMESENKEELKNIVRELYMESLD
jgi:DNA repair exonuclease SbcCD nuclease subunit